MVENMKTDIDRLLLVSKLIKSSILLKYIGNFFSFSNPKVVYIRPFLSSLPFPKFWKENFMYFSHKRVETGPNCSHELATFLKYHMPLKACLTYPIPTLPTHFFSCSHFHINWGIELKLWIIKSKALRNVYLVQDFEIIKKNVLEIFFIIINI